MKVNDVFHFQDGRTVLVVHVDDAPKLIEAGTYELRRNGALVQAVQVENEMFSGPTENRHNRSVSTAERLDIPSGPPDEELTLVPA